MSSTFVTLSSKTLPELLSMRTEIDAAIGAACGGGASGIIPAEDGKKAKGKKEKKESSRTGKPTAYGAFSSKIQKDFAEQIKEFKEANPEMKGAHMTWVGKYKEEHPDVYEAFKAEWALAHPKTESAAASASGSADVSADEAVADAVADAKPKKVLSPEHLAKMKAGREAKKAAKDAEKALAEAEGRAEAPIAAKAKKEPKKAKKAADPEPIAAPIAIAIAAAAPLEEDGPDAEELPFKLGGATYIRMGFPKPDGNPEWLSTDLWLSKKGVRGAYAGELMEDGSINADADEPTLETA